MRLMNIPRCSCGSDHGSVLAITESQIYCARCLKVQSLKEPQFVDVPDEIATVVIGLTHTADLRIIELRPKVWSQFYSDSVQITMIKAVTDRWDAECHIQWGKQLFPLRSARPELNARGKAIDMQKLPTATTPQMRNYLRLLQKEGFLITDLSPMGSDMAMDLEKWFGPEALPYDQTPHEKLVVRIQLRWSMDMMKGLQEVLNALGKELPYAADLRVPVKTSQQAGFAGYPLCLQLIESVRSHVDTRLANEIRQLSCGEKEALLSVSAYAQYYAKCINQRVEELAEDRSDEVRSRELSEAKPRADYRQEVAEKAMPHVRLIYAAFSLFVRLAVPVIKMQATLDRLQRRPSSGPHDE